MKNKLIFGAAAALSIFTMASCKKSSSEDYNVIRKDSSLKTEVVEAFGTDFGTKGSILDSSEKTGTYYDLYASKADATSSLFVYSYDLTDYFKTYGNRNRSITISTLSYMESTQIYSSEQTAILTAAFDSDTGVKTKLPNIAFDVTTSTSWTNTYTTTAAYKEYEAGKTVSITTVYMPVYAVHTYSSQACLQAYVFVPLCTAFTTSDGLMLKDNEWVTSTISSYTDKTSVLDTYLAVGEEGFDQTKIYNA